MWGEVWEFEVLMIEAQALPVLDGPGWVAVSYVCWVVVS